MTILEDRGLFWWGDEATPEKHYAPNSSVPGLLKIENDGRISLDLDGYLPNEHGPMVVARADPPETKTIRGILKGTDKRVLLLNLASNGGRISTNGISYERYAAMRCLVSDGDFQLGGEPPQLPELEAPLSGFEEWLQLNAIKVKRSKKMISATYKWPKDAIYPSKDEKLSFVFDVSGGTSSAIFGDAFSIKETASLKLRFKKPYSLGDIQRQYSLLEDLLTLLSNADYPLDWPWVLSDQGTRYRFYFLKLRSRDGLSAPQYYECLTNFVQLREQFGEIWSNWKKKHEEFGPGFYLYLGTRRGMKLYSEHRFVNLVWGIEALHRKKNTIAVSNALEKKIGRILSQVKSTKDKDWLTKKLKNAHEPSLAERLFDTCSSVPLGLDRSRLRSFAESCAKLRNELSHFGGQRHGSYGEFAKELRNKSAALSTLYHALLLYEIGVSEKIINRWLYNGFRSHSIKRDFVEAGLLDESCLTPGASPKGQ